MVKDLSVILPIYNEVHGVERAVRSAVHQCEVLYIADNASTDGSSEICQRLAKEFPNIVYTRHERNMGGDYNGAFLLAQVKTPYFICFGGHDYIGPGYAAKLKSMLEENPDAVLAGGRCLGAFMDNKSPIVRPRPDPNFLASNDPFVRVNHIASGHCSGEFEGFIQYGVRKTAVYKECCRKPLPHIGGDLILLMRQAQKGKILLSNDAILYFEQYRLLSWRKALFRLRPEEITHARLEQAFSRMTKWIHIQLLRAAKSHFLPFVAPRIIRTRFQTANLYTGFRIGKFDWSGWLCDAIKSFTRKFLFVREGDDYLLRCRLKDLKSKAVFEGKKIALYGAGLHTVRLLDSLIIPYESIVAIFDDNPKSDMLEGIPVVPVSKANTVKFDLLLLSSDTVESRLHRQATHWMPEGIPILRIYSWRIWRWNLKMALTPMGLGNDYCLRERLENLRDSKLRNGQKLALYGAGLHTRRLLDTRIIPSSSIVAIFDDAPKIDAICGIPVLPISAAASRKYDYLLVSSDTIEALLYKKAQQWSPKGVKVLRLYFWRLWRRNSTRPASVAKDSRPEYEYDHFLLRIHYILQERGVFQGKKIALYGMGLHTKWILETRLLPEDSISAIYQDEPQCESFEGVKVLPASQAPDGDFEFLIINTNTPEEEEELCRKALRWPNKPQICLLHSRQTAVARP